MRQRRHQQTTPTIANLQLHNSPSRSPTLTNRGLDGIPSLAEVSTASERHRARPCVTRAHRRARARYISAIYGALDHRLRDPRDARLAADERLRDQVDRRQVDPLLLGGELRPDLPGASPAVCGRADRGQGRAPRAGGSETSTASPPAGRRELRAWLEVDAGGLRAPRRGPAEAVLRRGRPTASRRPGTLDAMRRGHERMRRAARGRSRPRARPTASPTWSCSHGIEFHEWIADWCERTRARRWRTRRTGERRTA